MTDIKTQFKEVQKDPMGFLHNFYFYYPTECYSLIRIPGVEGPRVRVQCLKITKDLRKHL